MPEVFTASYNPVTGERREFRQEVVPPPPPDYGMSSINPAAVEYLYRTQKIEDAEKAIAAAIQFQGLRGYQQALKENPNAPEKALAKWGPQMFYSKPQAFGPSVKALTPPQINPNQAASLKFREEIANRDKFQNVGGSLVRITPKGEAKVEIPSRSPSPESTFQRRLDQDEYKTYFEQANEAKIRLSNPNMSPESKSRYQRMLESATEEMSKIRSKWQPSTGTNAPLSEQAKSFKPPTAKIPDSAIEYLRKNPNLRGAFDAKYGEGSAALFLQ